MPLDVGRLRDSDLASDETPEACWAAVLLWCASWHQIPAASIPDNDQWLAKQAGYAARKLVQPLALQRQVRLLPRGWTVGYGATYRVERDQLRRGVLQAAE